MEGDELKWKKQKKSYFRRYLEKRMIKTKKISEELMREFSEELKPVGITCKNWSKNT